MVLHELHFRSRRAFAQAFERLVLDPSVETCLADSRALTLCFRAAPSRLGALLAAVPPGTRRADVPPERR